MIYINILFLLPSFKCIAHRNDWIYCAAYEHHNFSFQSPLTDEEHELQQVEENNSLYEPTTGMTVNICDYTIIENQNV